MPTSRAAATSRWPVSWTSWWSLSHSANVCGVSGSWRCTAAAGRQRRCAPAQSSARGWSTRFGVEPGPALRSLEAAILEQRPELEWSAPGRTQGADRAVPTPASGSIATDRPAGPRSGAAADSADPVHDGGRRRQPRLPGDWRRICRPDHRSGVRLPPRHVVGRTVRTAGSPAGGVLPADPVRQARDGSVGQAAACRCRALDGGHQSRARCRRIGASGGAGRDRRRPHRHPLRGDASGAHPLPRALWLVRPPAAERRLPHRTARRRRRGAHRVHGSEVGLRCRVAAPLPERRRRPRGSGAVRQVPASPRRAPAPPAPTCGRSPGSTCATHSR